MKETRTRLCFFSFSIIIVLSLITPSLTQTSNEEQHEQIKRSQFPDGFFFGTSTSAYQVEGAYLEDGKSITNWDVFSHLPGNIKNNDNGDIADDHYHRYLEDMELVHALGVNAYRFSISWARILPGGRSGNVNPKGIMFYNKIIDNLLLRGIEPFVTLFHFDMPQILENKYKGWLHPLMQEELVYLATICFEEFGDRVKYWMTINEPDHFADFGYKTGQYPPARCSPPFGNCSLGNSDTEVLIVMHNMIMAHAKVSDVYHKHFQLKQGGFIGITINAVMYEPLRDEEVDRQAVDRALAFSVGWALDPLVHGDYPPEMQIYLGTKLPKFSQRQKELLNGSLDFIGINHYITLYAKDCIHSACSSKGHHPLEGFVEITGERDGTPIGQPTGMPRFYVVPRGMEKVIDYMKQRYNNIPMFVTENGVSSPAHQSEKVEDLLNDYDLRIKFHKAYLSALATAMRKGADVRGYFIWSLIDSFEWINGYNVRFGIYYVNRSSLERIPKLSAKWFTTFLTNTTTYNQEEEEFSSKGFSAT
ncbi:hypothetical protein UlMin_022589 [Ulmus minor]